MKRFVLFLFISVFFCRSAAKAIDITLPISHDGYQRIYTIHLPSDYKAASKYPLVFVLHGGGGDIDGIQKITQFSKKADKEGFIVAYPRGIGKEVLGTYAGSWNAGRCCGEAMEQNVDDVGFFRTLIDELEKNYPIDSERIYSTGLSNGAQMSYRLACELSDKIAAIAPVSSQNVNSACQQSRHVPILHIHGTQDECARYSGGSCGGCYEKFVSEILNIPITPSYWECSSVPESVASWQSSNGCSSAQISYYKNNRASCVSYKDCPNRGGVEFCKDEDLGHNWAGGEETLPACDTNPTGPVCKAWQSSVGPMSDSLSGTDLIWEFFKQHTLSDGSFCTNRDIALQKISIKSNFSQLQKAEKRLGKIQSKINGIKYNQQNLVSDQSKFFIAYKEIPETFLTCEKTNCQKVDLSGNTKSILRTSKSLFNRIKKLDRRIRKSGSSSQVSKASKELLRADLAYSSTIEIAESLPLFRTECKE